MLPSSRIFRSRWTAAIWAGGILWMAIDVAGSAPSPAPTDNAAAPTESGTTNAAELAVIADAMN